MALGGGTWTFQNKVLPGAYINFKSKANVSMDIADRGYGAMPLELDWGPVDQVFTVTAEDFQQSCAKYFGYNYSDDKMIGLRDLFRNLQTGYFYRLSNSAVAAAGATMGTAKYPGTRGNDITVTVEASVDITGSYVVSTYIKMEGVNVLADTQTVAAKSELVDNDFVVFTKTGTLTALAGETFTGGSNGTTVTGTQHQAFITAIEPYYFNVLGVVTTDSTIMTLYRNFVKRMRDDVGMKFQLVLYNDTTSDYEGIISVMNKVTDTGASAASLVYWVTGAEAGCAVNATCSNKTYDGEYTVDVNYSQTQLKAAINNGQLVFHRVTDPASGNVTGDIRILTDINTFTSFSVEKNKEFAKNQVIRVLDQVAIDISRVFNRTYLGKAQNDADGRVSFWNDVISYCNELQQVRAISNFTADDVPIPTEGTEATAVVGTLSLQPVCSMEKLYFTVIVA